MDRPINAGVSVQCGRIGILDQELAFSRVENGHTEAENDRDDVERIRNGTEEGEKADAGQKREKRQAVFCADHRQDGWNCEDTG